MFYETKEGYAVSLDGVRCVRIGESPGYSLKLLYNDQTAVTVQNSESRDDLLPAYRAILKLLGCGDGEDKTVWPQHGVSTLQATKDYDGPGYTATSIPCEKCGRSDVSLKWPHHCVTSKDAPQTPA